MLTEEAARMLLQRAYEVDRDIKNLESIGVDTFEIGTIKNYREALMLGSSALWEKVYCPGTDNSWMNYANDVPYYPFDPSILDRTRRSDSE